MLPMDPYWMCPFWAQAPGCQCEGWMGRKWTFSAPEVQKRDANAAPLSLLLGGMWLLLLLLLPPPLFGAVFLPALPAAAAARATAGK